MKYDEFVKMNEQGASHWWYMIRRELVKQELKKLSCKNNDLRMLDLATACGDNFAVCNNYGKTFGIDISEHAIKYCKQKDIKTIVQGDVQKLPFKSNIYDIVLALDVFEHIVDDIASMKEISRVLKEKGKLIFNVPAFRCLFSYHDEAFQHLRRYNIYELRKKMGLARLQVKSMTYWSFFIFPVVFILRKFVNPRKKRNAGILSDFHRRIHPSIEKFLKLLSNIELIFIKRNIFLPFGVSIYGIAQKKTGL